MLRFRGAPALSDFRLNKLQLRLEAELATAVGLYAEFVHFADLDEPLTAREQEIL